MKKWTHDELAIDLANSLRTPDRMVWTDIQLGPAHSPRPDVFTLMKSFTRPLPTAYEVKVSRSDFLADVTAGKWTKYQRYAHTVTFACVAGLIQKADVPEQCGLIWRHENAWRYAKRPTVNPVALPQDAWLKLLIDGVEREGPRYRAKNFSIDNGFSKRYGSEAARWVSDAAAVKDRVQYAEDSIRDMKERAQKDAEKIKADARRDGGEQWRLLLEILELPADANVWTVRGKISELRRIKDGMFVDGGDLSRIYGDLSRCYRALGNLIESQKKEAVA